jgi:exodeoxyribonuclease-3
MRFVTWNVNGLRAAIGKGLDARLAACDPDVVLLQEIRCTEDKLPKGWAPPSGATMHWNPATKPGWSGTATWAHGPSQRLGTGIDATDDDGRVLRIEAGGVEFVNCYLPSGSAGPERQAAKEMYNARFLPFAASLAKQAHPVVLCGDLNVAHTELDVHAPGPAKKLSGFMPHERAWFSDVLATGWTDVVRRAHGPVKGPYTWWSNFGRAKVENRGWRIDYVLANAAASKLIRSVRVDRESGIACSDHAPTIVELDVSRPPRPATAPARSKTRRDR